MVRKDAVQEWRCVVMVLTKLPRSGPMKRFLIKYTYNPASGPVEDWHRHIKEFIAGLDSDPELKGRIGYLCMKAKDSANYYHIAEARDDDVPNLLQLRDFFKRYTEETKRVGGGTVEVLPLETIAETRT
jgi:hypothetical protein